jgi:hypothetical protein
MEASPEALVITAYVSACQPAVPHTGSDRLGDGTLLSCADHPGRAQRSESAGQAACGYCAAESRWHRGMRPLHVSGGRDMPLGHDLRPANEIPGPAQRIGQRLPALTLGIFLNSLLRRPARVLAAYLACISLDHRSGRPSRTLVDNGAGATGAV